MYDIITFGSATWDLFVKPGKFKIVKDEKNFVSGEGVCFNFGSKVDIKEIYFSSGGGGTNTAATFAMQGFKSAYCGTVGDDISGREIIRELQTLKVDTSLIKKTKEKPTNHSIVINTKKEDRTILVYRGAAELMAENDVPWDKLKAKWFYIAPLSGRLCNIFDELVLYAKKNNIRVAINPGNCQLSYPLKKLEKILKDVDILLLNQEEASLLTKIPYSREKEIFKKIDAICPKIAIMTKGDKGLSVSDGKTLYTAKPPKTKVVDKTGAGDALGSGFVAEYMRSGNIEKAIALGMENATNCVGSWGAKSGILKKGESAKRAKIVSEPCGKNNSCKNK